MSNFKITNHFGAGAARLCGLPGDQMLSASLGFQGFHGFGGPKIVDLGGLVVEPSENVGFHPFR